jgi:hypothetical protein
MLFAAVLGPHAVGWASDRFPDVLDASAHHDNINAIADAGVTLGCGGGDYCPANSVTRAQMGSFLARLGGLSSGNTTNLPVANGRSPIRVYCELAQRHPATFDPSACTTKSEFLATLSPIEDIPVVIGSGGIPYVAYYETSGADLRIARCWSHECAGFTYFSVDTAGNTGQRPSMTVGRDGLPYVAYYDFVAANWRLKIAHCITPACDSVSVQPLDPSVITRNLTSIVIGQNGYPLIAYSDQGLKVIRCANVDCSSFTTVLIDSISGETSPAMKLAPTGFPVIAYQDPTLADLKFARCVDANCDSPAVLSTLESTNDVGVLPSMAIGLDGRPLILHFDNTMHDLRLARCADAECSSIQARAVDDFGSDAGYRSSIAIGLDGRAVFTFFDNGANLKFLRLARCVDRACSDNTNSILDSTLNTGIFSSVAMGIDGVPVISYGRGGSQLRVARPALDFLE